LKSTRSAPAQYRILHAERRTEFYTRMECSVT
jgi:hypothetical protein